MGTARQSLPAGRRSSLWAYFAIACAFLSGVGCSPSLEPLYRDFESSIQASDSLQQAVREAVEDAGWETVPSTASNVVATEARTIRRWGLYRVEVSLEVTPINRNYVRVMIHPYRVYFTGARAKMPFLKRSVRRAVLPALQAELEERGMRGLRTAEDRDRIAGG